MQQTIVDKDNLGQMLDKFFAGDTTCVEEKALEKYFCSGMPVPSEYECYRAMFGWYASGMDYDALPAADVPAAIVKPVKICCSKWHDRVAMWWSAAAAVVVIAVVAGLGISIATFPEPPEYADCFVTRAGMMIIGEQEIKGDVDAALAAAYCLELEIDMKMDKLNNSNID